MVMHLMFPGSLHLLGDMEPVRAVQRAQGAVHHLSRVEFGRGVGCGAAAAHGVVLQRTRVQVGVLEARALGRR